MENLETFILFNLNDGLNRFFHQCSNLGTSNSATRTTSHQLAIMRVSLLSLVLSVLATSVTDVQASCEDADWSSSFNNKGLSMCDNSRKFMTGLYRDDRGNTDRLKRLDGARCCSRPTPWRQSSNMVIHSNWWSLLDNNNRWATCPDGYFLNGLYRDKDHDGWLHNIEEGRCVKPADAPYSYKNCVDKSVASCFNNKGWCNCNSGSFLTGIYRGDCDELHCLNKFRCCEPADEREVLDELFKVRNIGGFVTSRSLNEILDR